MPVDGRAGDRHRQSGAEQRLARDIAAGRAFLHRAAKYDVLDFARIDAGAVDRIADGVRGKRRPVRVVEGAAIGLADRRAGGGDDHGFGHRIPILGQWCDPYAPASGALEEAHGFGI